MKFARVAAAIFVFAIGNVNAAEVLEVGLSVPDVVYSENVDIGFFKSSRKSENGGKYRFSVNVPNDYDPNKAYPLHVILHGGVDRPKPTGRKLVPRYLKNMAQEDVISLFPTAWRKAKWWQQKQLDNIDQQIEWIKQRYHIDTNKILLLGLSDGGHGSYYIAAHQPSKFAGFVPMLGNIFVLVEHNGAEHQTYINNLLNKPIFAVNATKDELYPIQHVDSFIKVLQDADANIKYRKVDSGHFTTKWFKDVKAEVADFTRETVRNPFPDHIIWQVDEKNSHPRIHWLHIDKLISGDTHILELNKKNNEVTVKAENIKGLTLLLSQQHFDFQSPIKVTVNGKVLFDSKVTASEIIQNKWYEKDKDVNSLYQAEIQLSL